MTIATRLLVFSLGFFLSGRALHAADLAGSVRTEDGRAVPQIVLILDGPSGSRTLVTGADGRYEARELRPGTYTLASDAPGFVLTPSAPVVVADADVRLDVRLAPAPIREQVVVSATRTDAAVSTLGTSVSVLDRERIAEREPSSVLQLLQDLPGIAVARTGGPGSQSSAFIRGGESRFARILVDGVAMNEPGGAFDFGSMLPLELERIEVVRGATSSLYGTDALAGVIHFVTRHGGTDSGVSLRAEAEGGSFDWQRYQGGTSGRSGAWDWDAGLLRLDTDNEAPNSAFTETAGACSLGVALGERSTLRFVLRAADSTRGTPGQTAFGRPDLDAFIDRTDMTGAAHLQHTRGRATHHLRLGVGTTDQLSVNPEDSGAYVPQYGDAVGAFELSDFPDPLGFQNDTARYSAGYQAEVEAGTRNVVTGGVDVEHETGDVGSRGGEILSPTRTNVGFYAQDRVVLGDRVFVTAGGRVEHNDSFGTAFVPRVAVAVRARGGADATTLRASGGAGIKEPSFLETFGTSSFAQGNPDLQPERSRTYDLGIEQRLFSGRLRAEATAFHHEYLDQIAFSVVEFDPFHGTYVNLGRTQAQGLELSLEAAPSAAFHLRADYTLTDGEIEVSASDFDPVYAVGKPLLRRPKHQASFSVRGGPERANVGATLVLVGRRADSDFSGLNLRENEGYARLDARARARLFAGLEAFVVAENVLDREYQEVLGYPALGRSVRGGLRFRAGSPR
jgi:vitamin B12 transporter